MSGASVPEIARRITLPLAWPAGAAHPVRARDPIVRGARAARAAVGIHVYTSSIYQAIDQYPSGTGLAAAYAVTLSLITSLGILRAVPALPPRAGDFRPSLAKAFVRARSTGGLALSRRNDLHRLLHRDRRACLFLVLVWSSLQKFYSAPSWAALRRISLDSYRAVLDYPQFANTVWNSIVLALGSATTVMLVSAVIAWIVVRTKVPGRWVLDNLASLPLALPARHHGLLSLRRHRRLRHAVDHLHRALSALRYVLQVGFDAADSHRSSRNWQR